MSSGDPQDSRIDPYRRDFSGEWLFPLVCGHSFGWLLSRTMTSWGWRARNPLVECVLRSWLKPGCRTWETGYFVMLMVLYLCFQR